MIRYLLDQIILLIVGIGILFSIPLLCGPISALVLQGLTLMCWGYLCRRIIVLPLDFCLGRVTRIVYFSDQCHIEEYEFFKRKYWCKWKFYYGNSHTLILLVPISVTFEEINSLKLPRKDERISVTYLRFSKLLLCWQKAQGSKGTD